jgi:carboxylesterase type B
MRDAWLSFARSGDPGWQAHDTERRPTMVFDAESRLEHDPFGAERRAWTAER